MYRGGGFLSISSPFGLLAHKEGIIEHNSGKPLLHAVFTVLIEYGLKESMPVKIIHNNISGGRRGPGIR